MKFKFVFLSGVFACTGALAGPEKIKFPSDYLKGVLYQTVDRHDIKQYRELYATPAAVEAVRKGQPIPSGTVLTLVQWSVQLDEKGEPTFLNSDDTPHQISVANGPKTAVFLRGQKASITLDKPGEYGYICGLHPNMKGVIEVK